jgi:hypothetical protein
MDKKENSIYPSNGYFTFKKMYNCGSRRGGQVKPNITRLVKRGKRGNNEKVISLLQYSLLSKIIDSH